MGGMLERGGEPEHRFVCKNSLAIGRDPKGTQGQALTNLICLGLGECLPRNRRNLGSEGEMEDRWARLEEIVRKVVREELHGFKQAKAKLRLENGRWTGISEEQLTAWRNAYPAVDVEKNLLEAAAWCVSNPNESPRSNFSRFLNTWLARHQDRASIRAISRPSPTASIPNLCEYCLLKAVGAANGRRHCREHAQDALDGVRPSKMPGVIAKAVAGE